jgi:hypothetical protein
LKAVKHNEFSIIFASKLVHFVCRPWYCVPKGLVIVNYNSIIKFPGVSRLVVKNIMLLLKGLGKAYCIEALESDRNALEQKARFARVIGDSGNPIT